MQKFKTVPHFRKYVHDRCGQETTVDGNEFVDLCDPRYVASRTLCVHCNKMDSLKAFRWSDTQEPLPDYRKRVASSVPLWIRITSSNWTFGFWLLVAVLVGYGLSQLFDDDRTAYAISGVIFFIVAMGSDMAGKYASHTIKYQQYK